MAYYGVPGMAQHKKDRCIEGFQGGIILLYSSVSLDSAKYNQMQSCIPGMHS